jgi:hypothetical protein
LNGGGCVIGADTAFVVAGPLDDRERLTVGLLVGAAASALMLIALDAIVPVLGLKAMIRDLVRSINFPTTLLNRFLAFLLFAGALQVNSARWPLSPRRSRQDWSRQLCLPFRGCSGSGYRSTGVWYSAP